MTFFSPSDPTARNPPTRALPAARDGEVVTGWKSYGRPGISDPIARGEYTHGSSRDTHGGCLGMGG